MKKIIAVLNGKGGVGKTTTAFNASAILAKKYQVLLVDSDPQGSATWWAEQRAEQDFEIAKEADPSILKELKVIDDYELIICDTPPHLDSGTLTAIIHSADYLVLPTPPDPLDIQALIKTIKVAIAPFKVPHRVVLTRVDPRSMNEAMEAQTTLMEAGIPVFNSIIREYKAHKRASLQGLPINYWKGEKAREAAGDYQRFIDELQREWN